MAHDKQVVGDEKIGQTELILKLIKHIDDLSLNGNVKSGDGLVAHDEFGVDRKGAGDAYPLALTAREFVGVAGGVLAVEADMIHQLKNSVVSLLLGLIEMMHVERLTDDVGDGHPRVEG